MSLDAIEAFPLAWPDGWRRTDRYRRTRAKFGKVSTRTVGESSWAQREAISASAALNRVLDELGRMDVPRHRVVISSNLPTRRDGLPDPRARQPDDPGVAVYWMDGKQRRCMAIDRYDRVADNLAAIAATLDAMRAIERHGGAEILDRAFTGFVALPAPEQPWQVLGVAREASREQIEDAHRRLAMKHHPDRGGSDAEMARINSARDALLESRT
jgi:hypothetical protein